MIYVLERAPLLEIVVGGVPVSDMGAAADAYREAIAQAGGDVTAHSKRFKKQEMVFVVRFPPHHDLAKLVEIAATIPEPLRGTVHWPEG